MPIYARTQLLLGMMEANQREERGCRPESATRLDRLGKEGGSEIKMLTVNCLYPADDHFNEYCIFVANSKV